MFQRSPTTMLQDFFLTTLPFLEGDGSPRSFQFLMFPVLNPALVIWLESEDGVAFNDWSLLRHRHHQEDVGSAGLLTDRPTDRHPHAPSSGMQVSVQPPGFGLAPPPPSFEKIDTRILAI